MQIIQLTQKYSIIIYPLEYLAMKVINSSNCIDEYLSSMYTQKFKSETETKRIRKIKNFHIGFKMNWVNTKLKFNL